ncbi:MAG: hypothetical protein K2O65_04760 [Lachnospiraceae bacterium]|nr:hypothetical protein [Lachnospiraceae bacterium]
MSNTNVMDICGYFETASESVQRSIESGNYEDAYVHLSSYLLEIYSRYQRGDVNKVVWNETIRFFCRMILMVIEESNIQQSIESLEKEN